MSGPKSRWPALLFALFTLLATAAEPLSRPEIAKLGKSATALVEAKLPGYVAHGSAFCVHPSGLFLTNEHVIQRPGQGGDVTLILDSSQKTQRVLKAKVVRVDKELDLALLRVDDGADGKLPALTIGSDEALSELDEVIAFGFPFGTGLAVDKEQYPAVSVNVGSVTALRRKDGNLHRIQLDAALNPGNSGGPVLDRQGRVVGIVVSGVRGSGVNVAIPVSHAAKFLARPDLTLAMPVITAVDRSKPAVFKAKAAALLPGAKPLTLELILKPEGGPERRFPMQANGNIYQASAVPVPAIEGALSLRVEVKYANGSLSGSVADRAFRAGERELKFSAVRLIRLRPKAEVVLHDGKIVNGPIAALGVVPVDVGGDTIPVNLARAIDVRLDRPAEASTVTCTVVASQDGKEVGRVSETITIQGGAASPTIAATSPGAASPAPTFRPPAIAEDRVVRELPAAFSRVCVGRGGQFLFFLLPAQKRVAVFDVSEAKVTKYLPVPEENAFVAAGNADLFIVLPTAGVVQRWNLTTMEREVSVGLPTSANINGAYMGCASDGPLLVSARDGATFFDPKTLKAMEITVEGDRVPARGRTSLSLNDGVRISANGKVFGSWAFHVSPSGFRVFVMTGTTVKLHYQHDSVGHITPSPDGRTIYTAIGRFAQNLTPIGEPDGGRGRGSRGLAWCVPAVQGNDLFVNIVGPEHRGDKKTTPLASVHWARDGRKLVDLPAVGVRSGINRWDREAIGDDQRLLLMPASRVLVELPESNNKVVLHRFDLDALLEKAGFDYLLVVSEPPTATAKGQTVSYQMSVKSKKGGVKYRLDSGPMGMKVSADGRLTWTVPGDWATKENDVIITVSDGSGQEVFHTFKITLAD